MSRLLKLPAQGRLLVGTDLQGNLNDFKALLGHFERAGEHAYLVLTGDLVHGPDEATVANWPDHLGTPYRDESPALVEALRQAQARFPGRVYCLLGNHDHSHIGGPITSKFHPNEAASLDVRLGPENAQRLKELVRTFPLVAVAPCGVAMMHAAPAAEIRSLEELETVPLEGYENYGMDEFFRVPVLGAMLWARMAKPDRSAACLAALGAKVALFGHDVVREGYAIDEADQLCFSTSFGLYDHAKVYLDLDLAAHYQSAYDVKAGVHIKRLYPDAVAP
jgi:hypothetical protein